jgi:hypothetical protein
MSDKKYQGTEELIAQNSDVQREFDQVCVEIKLYRRFSSHFQLRYVHVAVNLPGGIYFEKLPLLPVSKLFG